jgi:hypothetical protein
LIIDSMTRNGKNLFQIYERLRAAHPDILRVHHAHIEKEYVKSKLGYSLELVTILSTSLATWKNY